jgi:hypothetical protein
MGAGIGFGIAAGALTAGAIAASRPYYWDRFTAITGRALPARILRGPLWLLRAQLLRLRLRPGLLRLVKTTGDTRPGATLRALSCLLVATMSR